MEFETGFRLNKSEKEYIRQCFFREESNYLRETRNMKARRAREARGISAAGFEVIRALGKGSFGTVVLVREKSESPLSDHRKPYARNVYAMKVIHKSDMLRNAQEGHLRAERDFLVRSASENCNWIVPLNSCFQDVDNLYLVMEFEIGGDFLEYLLKTKYGVVDEATTRWYLAEMILCVEEAHKLKWIHRDVKPDNFLISASGHLRISDFGLAFGGDWYHSQSYYVDHRYALIDILGIEVEGDALDRREAEAYASVLPSGAERIRRTHLKPSRFERRRFAKSVVGTSQYMAPEVIDAGQYDGRCDWWSIGIILHECLFGYTPFARDNREATKAAVLHHVMSGSRLDFPSATQPISDDAYDLVARLLRPKEERLCSTKYHHNDTNWTYRHTREAPPRGERERDPFGRHVYSNDAEDLKRHPFFLGIQWDYLNYMQPPFIPRASDWHKNFASEADILSDLPHEDRSAAIKAIDGMDTEDVGVQTRLGAEGAHSPLGTTEMYRKPVAAKEKKRARDKLLRDATVAKIVMDVRKKGAFLGYTWKKPNTWSLGNEMRRPPSFAIGHHSGGWARLAN